MALALDDLVYEFESPGALRTDVTCDRSGGVDFILLEDSYLPLYHTP
jgi:hypothetical protein